MNILSKLSSCARPLFKIYVSNVSLIILLLLVYYNAGRQCLFKSSDSMYLNCLIASFRIELIAEHCKSFVSSFFFVAEILLCILPYKELFFEMF